MGVNVWNGSEKRFTKGDGRRVKGRRWKSEVCNDDGPPAHHNTEVLSKQQRQRVGKFERQAFAPFLCTFLGWVQPNGVL